MIDLFFSFDFLVEDLKLLRIASGAVSIKKGIFVQWHD